MEIIGKVGALLKGLGVILVVIGGLGMLYQSSVSTRVLPVEIHPVAAAIPVQSYRLPLIGNQTSFENVPDLPSTKAPYGIIVVHGVQGAQPYTGTLSIRQCLRSLNPCFEWNDRLVTIDMGKTLYGAGTAAFEGIGGQVYSMTVGTLTFTDTVKLGITTHLTATVP